MVDAYGSMVPHGGGAFSGKKQKNGSLILDRNTKQLTVDGEPVHLTATEYRILELLMEHPGYVFSAEQIYNRVWQEEAYTITLGLPQEAVLQEADAGRSRYRVAETGLEIMTEVFLSSDLHSALRHVSGQDADSLTVLETTRFSLPEYQFAWYEAETGQLCRADLVMDGMTCYAVVCATPEDAGDSLLGEVRAVLATFGLSRDEGV